MRIRFLGDKAAKVRGGSEKEGVCNNLTMKEKHFDVGNFVRLKSGGPRMTVETVFAPSFLDQLEPDIVSRTERGVTYRCYWFVGNKLQKDNFSEGALEIAADETAQAKPPRRR